MLKSMKTSKQQIQLLSFYSKCVPQLHNKILFEIVNDLQL